MKAAALLTPVLVLGLLHLLHRLEVWTRSPDGIPLPRRKAPGMARTPTPLRSRTTQSQPRRPVDRVASGSLRGKQPAR